MKTRILSTIQLWSAQAKLASTRAVRALLEKDLLELENKRLDPNGSRIRTKWYTVDSPEVKAMSKR
ncbi:coil containing protein [Vibrio phage 1.015.O._10N.222.51.E5]|nr:coil containing protein [Vibrio phage 1.015.O._10N.222.51.E5]